MISESLDAKIKLENEKVWTKLTDLGLIVARAEWPRAAPKTSYLEIPGGDGKVDLSEVLRGEAVFGNVSGTLNLIVLRPEIFDFSGFLQHYHGRRVMVRMGDDDDFYHVGRCWVSADDRKNVLRRFSVSFDAEPYRYALAERVVSVPVRQAQPPYWEYADVDTGKTGSSGGKINRKDNDGENAVVVTSAFGLEVKAAIKPYTLYSLSIPFDSSKGAISLFFEDGSLLYSPLYFNSGEHTELHMLAKKALSANDDFIIRDMVLMEAQDEVIVKGRKFATPAISGGRECFLASTISYTDAISAGGRQVWKMEKSSNNGELNFWGEYYGQYWYCKFNKVASTTSRFCNWLIIDFSDSSTFADGVATLRNLQYGVVLHKGNVVFVSDKATAERNAVNFIEDYYSLAESEDRARKTDFSLAAGKNQVIAYSNAGGGYITLTFREGYI